ncbi:Os06g0585900 [Oryza sativa Japonica Group]|uniref:Os06g0585900 protein n=2 Tax=Oryza sativa subsp. japonica TaxID=39947 RepID=C7J4C6_ORYSJ|nr:hypothetical protein OsJ_21807 [Oryza sativa Japonica Group]BAH93599.1 Os06g0585900 [Oryza sativa Japonica Group]BAS98385.1 Os06g0585900 [Oryza sativa Japonica Group]|eukprot:NP_001174871.1 Os06g0585900 [Oryza sativa Japonica Group]
MAGRPRRGRGGSGGGEAQCWGLPPHRRVQRAASRRGLIWRAASTIEDSESSSGYLPHARMDMFSSEWDRNEVHSRGISP